MGKKFNKLIRSTHRDLGYFFFAMCIIYGVSGIAINHRGQWNPNYIVNEKVYPVEFNSTDISEEQIKQFLSDIGEKGSYKKHVKKGDDRIKVFIKNGSLMINIKEKKAELETIKKRPVFHQLSFLHYNGAKHLWTIFSDCFALSLIILAFSGLFMVKGKNGIKRRGGILTAIGIIIPIILFLMYSA